MHLLEFLSNSNNLSLISFILFCLMLIEKNPGPNYKSFFKDCVNVEVFGYVINPGKDASGYSLMPRVWTIRVTHKLPKNVQLLLDAGEYVALAKHLTPKGSVTVFESDCKTNITVAVPPFKGFFTVKSKFLVKTYEMMSSYEASVRFELMFPNFVQIEGPAHTYVTSEFYFKTSGMDRILVKPGFKLTPVPRAPGTYSMKKMYASQPVTQQRRKSLGQSAPVKKTFASALKEGAPKFENRSKQVVPERKPAVEKKPIKEKIEKTPRVDEIRKLKSDVRQSRDELSKITFRAKTDPIRDDLIEKFGEPYRGWAIIMAQKCVRKKLDWNVLEPKDYKSKNGTFKVLERGLEDLGLSDDLLAKLDEQKVFSAYLGGRTIEQIYDDILAGRL
jgi:hypothetical protein